MVCMNKVTWRLIAVEVGLVCGLGYGETNFKHWKATCGKID